MEFVLQASLLCSYIASYYLEGVVGVGAVLVVPEGTLPPFLLNSWLLSMTETLNTGTGDSLNEKRDTIT